jgi:hypothetical protein
MQTMQVVNQGEGTIKVSTIPGQTEFILRISVIPFTVNEVKNTVEVPHKRAYVKKQHVVEEKPIEPKLTDAKHSVMTQPRKMGRPKKTVEEPTVTRIKLQSPAKMNQYLGKIGDRNVYSLVLQEQKQDRVGTTSRWTYLFREEKTGKTAIWITYRDHRIVNGQTYNLNASIKKFYDRRGVKSTLLTRGKIVGSEE